MSIEDEVPVRIAVEYDFDVSPSLGDFQEILYHWETIRQNGEDFYNAEVSMGGGTYGFLVTVAWTPEDKT